MIEYKGYIGVVDFDPEIDLFPFSGELIPFL